MPGPARSSSGLTLMAVHAHPDDEVLGTGGVFVATRKRGFALYLSLAPTENRATVPEV